MINAFVRKFLLILALCPLIHFAYGQQFKTLDSLAAEMIKNHYVKGIAITAVHDGKIVYEKGFGYADERNVMNDNTRLYIASNTKAFTGLAMAQLISKGLIHLDDPLSKYIAPEYFPVSIAVDSIFIQQVLSHTHGLSNDPLIFRTAYSGEYPDDLRELLKFTTYRKGKPDHSFRYSNLGYILAGIIIEQVTGKSWKRYIDEKILGPLDMLQTTALLPVNETVALPYRFDSEQLKLKKTGNTLHAAGGLFSTTTDLGKWLLLLTGTGPGNFMNDTLRELYETTLTDAEQSMGPFTVTGYSFGWAQGRFFDVPLRLHFGTFPGYESFMSYIPGKQDGVFVFVNESEAGIRVAGMLAAVYYASVLKNNNPLKTADPFLSVIEKTKAGYKPFDAQFINADSKALSPGIYTSDEYGTLQVSRSAGHYIFKLGELESPAFKGKENNELLVEWTPGIIEHLFWEEKKSGYRYDDVGFFAKRGE